MAKLKISKGDSVKFSYFYPLFLFAVIALTVLAFVVLAQHKSFSFVFLAFISLLAGGYLFYFITLRLAIYRRTKGFEYFRLLYHIPYMAFLVPAAIISYMIIPLIIDKVVVLTVAFAAALILAGIVFYYGLWLVVKTTPSNKLNFRLTAFLPLIIYLIIAGGLGALLIPFGLGSITVLSVSFGVSVFFAAALYMLGQTIIFISSKQSKMYFKLRYLFPLGLYVATALSVAVVLIPKYHDNLIVLLSAYASSLFGITVCYFFLACWMLNDENKSNTQENE